MNTLLKVKIFNVSIIQETLYVGVFTTLAIYTPYIVHFFGGTNAGQKFLPLPFFVLLAGILLGWRAGLTTAIAAPLISYLISGMPMINILPFIMLQSAVLGAISGILRRKENVVISLTAAIALGWMTIGIALFIFSKINALNYVVSGIKNGLPGIVLELVLIPIIIVVINKYLSREERI